MIFDLHIHTDASACSTISLSDIIRQARTLGLDGVCITDHNRMDGCKSITEGIQDNGLCVLVGMEYDTPDGDFLLFGDFEGVQPGLSAQALLKLVSDGQGVAIGAHPLRKGRPLALDIAAGGCLTVIETQNGRSSNEENQKAHDLASRLGLFGCGGSDAHSLVELGTRVTVFQDTITRREDLIAALKSGCYQPALRIPPHHQNDSDDHTARPSHSKRKSDGLPIEYRILS